MQKNSEVYQMIIGIFNNFYDDGTIMRLSFQLVGKTSFERVGKVSDKMVRKGVRKIIFLKKVFVRNFTYHSIFLLISVCFSVKMYVLC